MTKEGENWFKVEKRFLGGKAWNRTLENIRTLKLFEGIAPPPKEEETLSMHATKLAENQFARLQKLKHV